MSPPSEDGSAEAPVPERPLLEDFSKLPQELRNMIIDSTYDPNQEISVYLKLTETGPDQFNCRWTPSSMGNPGWTWHGEGSNAAFGPTVGFVCKEFHDQVEWRMKYKRTALKVHVVEDASPGSRSENPEPGTVAVPTGRLTALSYVKFDDWLTAALTFTLVVIYPDMLLNCIDIPLRSSLTAYAVNIRTLDYLMENLPTREVRVRYRRGYPRTEEDLKWTRADAKALFQTRSSSVKLTVRSSLG
jgi:hypothetical protein